VVVRAPGRLTQRNLHADDCLVPVMPLLCFVVGADNGSLLVQDTLLGDASCTHIDQSAAADWLLKWCMLIATIVPRWRLRVRAALCCRR
jgi:hypothetical protein